MDSLGRWVAKERRRPPNHARAVQTELSDADRTLFKRLVISYQDMVEARQFLNRLQGLNGESPPTNDDQIQRSALMVALIVSYSRPFTRHKHDATVAQRLPKQILEAFTREQQDLHAKILRLRNEEFAHSDPGPADVKVYVGRFRGLPSVTPVSTRTREGLTKNELQLLDEMFAKLHTAYADEMDRIRETLEEGDHF